MFFPFRTRLLCFDNNTVSALSTPRVNCKNFVCMLFAVCFQTQGDRIAHIFNSVIVIAEKQFFVLAVNYNLILIFPIMILSPKAYKQPAVMPDANAATSIIDVTAIIFFLPFFILFLSFLKISVFVYK